MPPAAEEASPAESGASAESSATGAGPESAADPAAGAAPAGGTEASPADGDRSAPEPPPAAAARPVQFRVAPAPRAPEPGRDHQVIRSAEEWAAFAADPAAAPPAVDFPREMIVVLRDKMGSDPPSRLAVVSVSAADALVFVCRVEQAEDEADATRPPGQAVVLPATDLPIRVLVR
jgi:hypothetical protein